tara:strand:+ start:57 stop:695 length:639 start_codon:yes stop_codon:yes gene_type:complete
MSDNEQKTNMGIMPMFATPLFVFTIPNWNRHRKTILNLLPKIDPIRGHSSDRNRYDIELPHYTDVVLGICKEQIKEFSRAILESKGIKEYDSTTIDITEMWFDTDTAEASYSMNNNGNVGWTAILHIDFDREVHRPPYFLSAFPKADNGDIDSFEYPVDEGVLIIFPSTTAYQPGAINPEEDVKRTTVTFNIQTNTARSLKTITYEVDDDTE